VDAVTSDVVTGRPLRVAGQPVLKTDAAGNLVKAWVFKSEEKGSDANLAAHLLRDAYCGACRCALGLKSDSIHLPAPCGSVAGIYESKCMPSISIPNGSIYATGSVWTPAGLWR
jgi:hypothetical protein